MSIGKKISKLSFNTWSIFDESQDNAYIILPTFTHQLVRGEQADNIKFRIRSKSCPVCESQLRVVFQDSARDDETGTAIFYYACDNCGFWKFHLNDLVGNSYTTIPHVKRFDYEQKVFSLSHLSKEIFANREKIYSMNPTNFEIFVGSILSDFLDCEVHHIGKSGDDGIDLLALVSDSPLMIQVKRRSSASATEGIDVVKLLFASAFAQGGNNGMVVTSAKSFTKPAVTWTQSPRIIDTGFKLDLIDINSLMSMMDAVAKKDTPHPWQLHHNRLRHFDNIQDKKHYELLQFKDFDVAVSKKTENDKSLIVFEHADLTKCYLIDAFNIENILCNRDIEFLQLQECLTSAATHILHDEKAKELVDSIPFNVRKRLVERWTTMYPEDIFEMSN